MELPVLSLADARPLIDEIEQLKARVAELESRPAATGVPEVLTEREAWEYLHIGRTTLAKLRRDGAIAYSYYAGKPMFRRSDLDAFVERETVRPRRLRATG